MRVFGWVVGALLFVVGVLSLVLAVSSFYALENESSVLTFFCTSDASNGTMDCRGDAGYGFQFSDLGAIGMYGVIGAAGVISGAVLIGAGMIAGGRPPVAPYAGGRPPVASYTSRPAGPPPSGPQGPPSGPPSNPPR